MVYYRKKEEYMSTRVKNLDKITKEVIICDMMKDIPWYCFSLVRL